MSNVRRLPGPIADVWDWQRLGSCRGRDSAQFFHPDGERGASRSRREAAAKAVCSAVRCAPSAPPTPWPSASRTASGAASPRPSGCGCSPLGWEDLADRVRRPGRRPPARGPAGSAAQAPSPRRLGSRTAVVRAAATPRLIGRLELSPPSPRPCASRSRRPGRPAGVCPVCACAGRRRSPAPTGVCSPGRGRPTARTTAARCRSTTASASVRRLPRAVVDPYLDPGDAPVLRPGHPGDHDRRRRPPRAPDRGVSMRDCVLIGACGRPAPRHPVRVEVGEAGQLQLGQPLASPTRSRTGRAPPSGPGSRARSAAARRSCRRPAARRGRRAAPRSGVPQVKPSDRPADDLVGAGLRLGLVEQVRERYAEPAGVADQVAADLVGDAGQRDVPLDHGPAQQLVEGERHRVARPARGCAAPGAPGRPAAPRARCRCGRSRAFGVTYGASPAAPGRRRRAPAAPGWPGAGSATAARASATVAPGSDDQPRRAPPRQRRAADQPAGAAARKPPPRRPPAIVRASRRAPAPSSGQEQPQRGGGRAPTSDGSARGRPGARAGHRRRPRRPRRTGRCRRTPQPRGRGGRPGRPAAANAGQQHDRADQQGDLVVHAEQRRSRTA